LQASQALLKHENQGLRHSLKLKQRDYEIPVGALELESARESHTTAILYSPRKICNAKTRRLEKDRKNEEERLEKLWMKDLRAEAKLITQERTRIAREERVKEKERRAQEKAEKAAARKALKHQRNAEKAIKLAQLDKRKASKPACQPQPKKRCVGSVAGGGAAAQPKSAPTPTLTRRGRTINTPGRFR
ncbi:hypothetical protein CC86DRAFT_268593, partial [Ophiobolus disseminans]